MARGRRTLGERLKHQRINVCKEEESGGGDEYDLGFDLSHRL
jgi:hypothetical protein